MYERIFENLYYLFSISSLQIRVLEISIIGIVIIATLSCFVLFLYNNDLINFEIYHIKESLIQ